MPPRLTYHHDLAAVDVVALATDTEIPALFPPPWSVDAPDPKLDQPCFIIRDANGQALAYVYFEGEPGRRSAADLLTPDEARRIAAQHRQAAGATQRAVGQA